MSNVKTEYVSDENSKSEGDSEMFSMKNPAAMFLLRALQELRLVDDTITVEDLQTFADDAREDMDLMVGNEKFLRERFDVIDQLNFHDAQAHYKTVDHLSEKIIQSQRNLARKDRECPL